MTIPTMWEWGPRSLRELRECDSRLGTLLTEALKASPLDITVIEGHRDPSKQLDLYERGLTRVRHSKHNKRPSLAVDVAPYPIDWTDRERFFLLAGVIYATATRLAIPVRWGGNWDGDADFEDQTFIDLVHWELVG